MTTDRPLTRADLQEVLIAVLQPIIERLGRLEARMDGLETRMIGVEAHMNTVEVKVVGLEVQMVGLKERLDCLEAQNTIQYKQLNAKLDTLIQGGVRSPNY